MNALTELQGMIDDFQEKVTSDQYVKMMDLCKTIHHHVLTEDLFIHLSQRTGCAQDGVFCDCNADKRVNMVLTDNAQIDKHLRTIASMAFELHYNN